MQNTEEIIQNLMNFNSHWESNIYPKSKFKVKRKLFQRIERDLQSHFIITIQGLRRTGKSVLQKQLVESYCNNAKIANSNRVLTFSFDNPDQLRLMPYTKLEEVLNTYFNEILREHPQEISSPILISLDEIQNIDAWQAVIKKYYDLNQNIKFILTGSSSIFLNKSSESLVGRSIDYKLDCLDFEEFLKLSNYTGQFPNFASDIEDLVKLPAAQIKSEWQEMFHQFLILGGFPDTAQMFASGVATKDIHKFIRDSIIYKIINLDLRKYFNFESSIADEKLFKVCANESGSFFEIKNLASEVGLARDSIKNHLGAFESSNLVYTLTKFDRKLRKEISSTKKYYVASPTLMYSLLYKENVEDKDFLGHAAETYAFNKLKNYANELYVDKFNQEKEIDFYLPYEKLLIESKYSTNAKPKEFRYLNTRAKELNIKKLVLSKSNWSIGNESARPLLFL